MAIALGAQLFQGSLAMLHYVTDAEVLLAWETFRRYSDKGWSFTDCTSRVVIQARGIDTALALDQHFRQFGTVAVVP